MAAQAASIAYGTINIPYAASSVCWKTALILGKPGGGKGTISKKIVNDFSEFFHHLSTGDVLRAHVRNQTEIGKEAHKFIKAGALVPDKLMIQILEDAKENVGGDKSLLLDGFPRTIAQARALDERNPIDFVINLDIPTETIIERISDRWIHAPSGRIYSYSYNPPKEEGKDDVTGEPLIQREDDRPECVRARLDTYDETTAPLIDYYGDKGVLQSFSGTKSDVIYVDVKEFLEGKL